MLELKLTRRLESKRFIKRTHFPPSQGISPADDALPELHTSTPLKSQRTVADPIEVLKKHVSDTLTFLHQERNDFLPDDDIIIPKRKDDHVAKEIDLECINLKTPRKNREFSFEEVAKPKLTFQEIVEQEPDLETSVRDVAEQEIEEVIKQAEEVVNEQQLKEEIKFHVEERVDSIFDDVRTNTEDSLDNLESLKDDSISAIQEKSEEAFRFLENEASSPLLHSKPNEEDSSLFLQREIAEESRSPDSSMSESQSGDSLSPVSPRSSIPLSKGRKGKEKKKKGKNNNDQGKSNLIPGNGFQPFDSISQIYLYSLTFKIISISNRTACILLRRSILLAQSYTVA